MRTLCAAHEPARARPGTKALRWACVRAPARVWVVGVCGRVWACVGVCERARVWVVGECGRARVWVVGVCGRVWACVGVGGGRLWACVRVCVRVYLGRVGAGGTSQSPFSSSPPSRTSAGRSSSACGRMNVLSPSHPTRPLRAACARSLGRGEWAAAWACVCAQRVRGAGRSSFSAGGSCRLRRSGPPRR